jgi:hypothetical protein
VDLPLVLEVIAQLGAQARSDGGTVRAIVQHGDAYLATRVRTDPVAEVFVATRALDGFELSIRWGDRWGDPDLGDRTFDSAFALATNDEPLMRAWLDETSRAALLASAYAYETDDIALSTMQAMTATRTWTYELANDELVVTKGAAESDARRFTSAVRTACAIAARSQRWAAEYAAIARQLGGTAAGEVNIGGDPVISATRSAIDVTMRLVRREPTSSDRLRTVISAPRIGEGRLAMWNDDLPKSARPALPGGKRFPCDGYQLRAAKPLDDVAKKLVVAARPAVVRIDADSVDVWFDGALSDLARIDTAIALAAHLAVDAIAPQGPYR